jgi:polar amino acid transport system ATP-binding protein
MNSSDATPMVRFENVTKRYGSLTVIDGLDLSIGRGEKVAMIGPSGSGKTTVLRMLMTLERIDGGVIWVDGERLTHVERNGRLVPADTSHLRRVRGKIGMVFQHFNLFPHMTALKNCMEAPVTVLGMKKREAEERAAELLAMVGLADKKDHFPSQLSGGQQQRVAEVLNVIRKLGAEHDLTMLMVTHQMGFAKEFADRISFFHHGKIEEDGKPADIFGNPKNERTRQFLHAVLDAG